MKNSFWMFFILLLIITVTSSLGGGIRYRENFLEEVFDINVAKLSERYPGGFDALKSASRKIGDI